MIHYRGNNMKPDYGKFLIESGIKKDLQHNFYDIPFDHLSRIDENTISTLANIEQNGQSFAASFDISKNNFSALLEAFPLQLEKNISEWINNPNSLHSSINFDVPFKIKHISAILGDFQKGQYGEVFAPMVVIEIS